MLDVGHSASQPATFVSDDAPSRGAKGYALSSAQRLMLMVQDAELFEATGFMIPTLHRVRGALSSSTLERALRFVANRHASLRTRLRRRASGAARLVVDPLVQDGAIRIIDLRLHEAPHREAVREARAVCDSPLDLGSEHPFRAAIIQIADTEHLVAICVHHLVADGWSLDVILRDTSTTYAAMSSDTEPALPSAPQHSDFQAWELSALRQGHFDGAAEYWRAQLREIPALPFRAPAPSKQQLVCIRRRLSPEASSGLRAACRLNRSTPFMFGLAALKFLVAAQHGQTDLTVATQMSNRLRPEVEDLVGYLANTVLLRTQVPLDATFVAALRAVRTTCLEAARHQGLPFINLVESLGLGLLGFDGDAAQAALATAVDEGMGSVSLAQAMGQLKRNPMLVFQYNEPVRFDLSGCSVELEMPAADLQSTVDATPLDAHVALVKQADDFDLYMAFQGELGDPDFAEQFADHYLAALSLVVDRPDITPTQLRHSLTLA